MRTREIGSSPLTRGTPIFKSLMIHILRFIPAYAGNSGEIQTMNFAMTVHPRLRGELAYAADPSAEVLGSSPLTRGTQTSITLSIGVGRFIPAYAGNSQVD